MFTVAVLCLTTLQFYSVAAQGECTDLRGRVIAHGLHYVPGPDTCTLCVCDNGLPKVCKAVLCSPPQDCRSFRVGSTCCEFICLDDVVKPAEGAEANVRIAVGGAAAVMLLTFALVVYRVRRQKRRRPPHADDQRSLTSIGYISGTMGYMGGTCETALSAWKPTNYLPRGEAPPPYDEVVAQCRTEGMTGEPGFHRTYPATVDSVPRLDEGMQCLGHSYANIPRPVQQLANSQNCYNAPLLQTVHQTETREPTSMPHHPLPANVVGFPSAIRLTGSLGAISNRGLLSVLQREPDHERPHNVPGFYTTTANPHASLHRTIPRISTCVEATLLDGAVGCSLGGFTRADRSLHGEIRRSFHKPSDAIRHAALADTGRSMPRNLNLASVSTHDTADVTHLPLALANSNDDKSNVRVTSVGRPRAHSDEHDASGDTKCMENANINTCVGPSEITLPAPQNTLPLTVDKPSCVCSYEGPNTAGGEGAEDADDYRSECENCKSASSSRWVLEEGWEGEDEEGTQTLQRRAPHPSQAPPATATLPQPVTKQSRAVMGPPSNWENWFNTIPDSDTESEDE